MCYFFFQKLQSLALKFNDKNIFYFFLNGMSTTTYAEDQVDNLNMFYWEQSCT